MLTEERPTQVTRACRLALYHAQALYIYLTEYLSPAVATVAESSLHGQAAEQQQEYGRGHSQTFFFDHKSLVLVFQLSSLAPFANSFAQSVMYANDVTASGPEP